MKESLSPWLQRGDRDDRRLYLRYFVKENYNVEKVEEAVDVIEEYLYANKERFDIESVYSYYRTGYVLSTLILTKEKEAHKFEAELREEIVKDLPKIAIGSPSLKGDLHRVTRKPSAFNYGVIRVNFWPI